MHPLFHPLFIDYCTYFNGNRDYFECHEALEEYWKEVAPTEKTHPLVGYVQLATGMYHWRRKNMNGALRILKKAYQNFLINEQSIYFEMIEVTSLRHHFLKSISLIEDGKTFQPFELEICHEKLAFLVTNKIQSLPEVPYDFLLHKHMLRDRSNILIARERKKKRLQ